MCDTLFLYWDMHWQQGKCQLWLTLSFSLSLCLSRYLSLSLSVCLCLSIYLSIYISISLSIYVCLSLSLSLYIYICICSYISIYMYIYRCIIRLPAPEHNYICFILPTICSDSRLRYPRGPWWGISMIPNSGENVYWPDKGNNKITNTLL